MACEFFQKDPIVTGKEIILTFWILSYETIERRIEPKIENVFFDLTLFRSSLVYKGNRTEIGSSLFLCWPLLSTTPRETHPLRSSTYFSITPPHQVLTQLIILYNPRHPVWSWRQLPTTYESYCLMCWHAIVIGIRVDAQSRAGSLPSWQDSWQA